MRRPTKAALSKILAGFLIVCFGSFLFVTLLGPTSFSIESFDFELEVSLSTAGVTEINLPPVGKVFAETHRAPLKLTATLENIDMQSLKEFIKGPVSKQKVLNIFLANLNRTLKEIVLKYVLLASAGGVFGILLLRSRNPRAYLAGAAVGGLLAGTLFLATYLTYDINKFAAPQYRGMLQGAPWVVGLAEETLSNVNRLNSQMEDIADNFLSLQQTINNFQPSTVLNDPKTVRILHVSDIHNNPGAYSFIQQVVENFEVSLVIDTGDITDFGTPVETTLVEKIEELQVPYFFVAGNHDSPTVIQAMRSIKNVMVLDGDIVNFMGIPILGIADPSAHVADISPQNVEVNELQAREMHSLIEGSKVKPVIFACHQPALAREMVGAVPVILHGHDHRYSMSREEGSVIIDAGTSGAAGIRGLQATDEVPFSFVLLYFQKDDDQWKLLASDLLKIDDIGGGFTLNREVFNGE